MPCNKCITFWAIVILIASAMMLYNVVKKT